MSWYETRAAVELACEDAFRRPGTVTPTSGAPFAVGGVLHDLQDEDVIGDDVGYARCDFEYHVRKTGSLPHAVSQFPKGPVNLYGTLALTEGGTTYDIVFVHEDDTMIRLGLAGPR